jgi:hypothetical protein
MNGWNAFQERERKLIGIVSSKLQNEQGHLSILKPVASAQEETAVPSGYLNLAKGRQRFLIAYEPDSCSSDH